MNRTAFLADPEGVFLHNAVLSACERFAEKVAVLDPTTGEYQTIEVGRSPHGLVLNPKGNAAPSVAAR